MKVNVFIIIFTITPLTSIAGSRVHRCVRVGEEV